jgi:hypothetical protein
MEPDLGPALLKKEKKKESMILVSVLVFKIRPTADFVLVTFVYSVLTRIRTND